MMIDVIRDSHGRFVRGTIPINLWDPKTGRFNKRKTPE